MFSKKTWSVCPSRQYWNLSITQVQKSWNTDKSGYIKTTKQTNQERTHVTNTVHKILPSSMYHSKSKSGQPMGDPRKTAQPYSFPEKWNWTCNTKPFLTYQMSKKGPKVFVTVSSKGALIHVVGRGNWYESLEGNQQYLPKILRYVHFFLLLSNTLGRQIMIRSVSWINYNTLRLMTVLWLCKTVSLVVGRTSI